MKTLAVILLGLVIFGNVMATKEETLEEDKLKEELEELLLPSNSNMRKHLRAIYNYFSTVITLSAKLLMQKLDTPGNLDMAVIAKSITHRLDALAHGSVELIAYVCGTYFRGVLPPAVVSLASLAPVVF